MWYYKYALKNRMVKMLCEKNLSVVKKIIDFKNT